MIEVIKVEVYARNSSGRVLSGLAHFSDGKSWKFIFNTHTWEPFFQIQSGKPSPMHIGDYVRHIAPKKRVDALIASLHE